MHFCWKQNIYIFQVGKNKCDEKRSHSLFNNFPLKREGGEKDYIIVIVKDIFTNLNENIQNREIKIWIFDLSTICLWHNLLHHLARFIQTYFNFVSFTK